MLYSQHPAKKCLQVMLSFHGYRSYSHYRQESKPVVVLSTESQIIIEMLNWMNTAFWDQHLFLNDVAGQAKMEICENCVSTFHHKAQFQSAMLH